VSNNLLAAVRSQHLEGIQFLVERGVDVNQGSQYGQTPLFLASKNGLDDSVDKLVKLGAKLELSPGVVRSYLELDVKRLASILLASSRPNHPMPIAQYSQINDDDE
jgi:ankyrin repeat protein